MDGRESVGSAAAAMTSLRIYGTVWKRQPGLMRPWQAREAIVTSDGFLQYKKRSDSATWKEVDLVKARVAPTIKMSNGSYYFEIFGAKVSFAIGLSTSEQAKEWLNCIMDVADENAGGRRAWVANLRRMLALSLRERKKLVPAMDRDWSREWNYCLMSFQKKSESFSTRKRRLKRLYTIWLQFHLFTEMLAELYISSIQRRSKSESVSQASRWKDTSTVDSDSSFRPYWEDDWFEVSPSNSTKSGKMHAVKLDDVDVLRFPTIRLEYASKSWRGHKRLEEESSRMAQFRATLELFISRFELKGDVMDSLPIFPLVASFEMRSVRVVATAQPSKENADIGLIDRRDSAELSRQLKRIGALDAFPFKDLPLLYVRKVPGTSDRTFVKVASKYDDVLASSLRSPQVHGVLIRNVKGEQPLQLLSQQDVQDMVGSITPQWISYLDLYCYKLDNNPQDTSRSINKLATNFLKQAGGETITCDVIIAVDPDNSSLPLHLKEGFIKSCEIDIYPHVRRVQELRKATSLRVSRQLSSQRSKSNVNYAHVLADESEHSLKTMFRQHVEAVASRLVTIGDAPRETEQNQVNGRTRVQSLKSGDTDSRPSNRSNTSYSNASTQSFRLRGRRSSVAAAASAIGGQENFGLYVNDSIHLKQVLRQAGVSTRFLPMVFQSLDGSRQPGMQVLVASEIVARLAKTLFKSNILAGWASGTRWRKRKPALIRLLDSIIHGLFHLEEACTIQECTGDQFWQVGAPIWLSLGPFASHLSFYNELDSFGGVEALKEYRKVLRRSPETLLTSLLNAFDARLTNTMLPPVGETAYKTMPFLRSTKDITFLHAQTDAKFELVVHHDVLWSHLQFFRLQFESLKVESEGKDVYVEASEDLSSYLSFLSGVSLRLKHTLGIVDPTRLEQAVTAWEDVYGLRARLLEGLHAATLSDSRSPLVEKVCQQARASITNSNALFPVEYRIALAALEALNTDDIRTSSMFVWSEVFAWLRYYYRPAIASQFLQGSSSHPVYAVLYLMMSSPEMDEEVAGHAVLSASTLLKTKLRRKQLLGRWMDVIASIDAHCKQMLSKIDGGKAVVAAAAMASVSESQNSRSLPVRGMTRSKGSNRRSYFEQLKQGNETQERLSQETMIAATSQSCREDLLWFIECLFLPTANNTTWKLPAQSFFMSPPQQASTALNASGVAVMWGQPLGLSLDQEAQLVEADASEVQQLAARPNEDGADIKLIGLPFTPLRRVAYVSCGYRHTALITEGDRMLYTFGHGECGRLGHGNEENLDKPAPVEYFASLMESLGVENAGVKTVSCGREHTMVVLRNGNMYGFGWAEAGRLGTGREGSALHPVHVRSLEAQVQDVTCGREHSIALTKLGQVFAFGSGFGGRLGIGSEDDVLVPTQVVGLDSHIIVRVDAGECHSAALDDKGTIFTWGFGSSGALGSGSQDNALTPQRVEGPWLHEFNEYGRPLRPVDVACGGYHTLALTEDGRVYGWGDAAAGQLGEELMIEPELIITSPQRVYLRSENNSMNNDPMVVVRRIACGLFTSAVCGDDGKLYAWGYPPAGNGAKLNGEDASTTIVPALEDFVIDQVACGAYHIVALTASMECE